MRELVSELTGTFVTPYDREDIYELAKYVDDIIDDTDEAASMFDIYQVDAVTNCVKGQADILVAATQELASALRFINEPARMEHHWQNIHKLEDAGDELLRIGHQGGLRRLLRRAGHHHLLEGHLRRSSRTRSTRASARRRSSSRSP